ncbi:AAA family ATPase [Paraburkholderia sp. RP-4-7]|uniref:AAA family ATPase n=1 Tax=Paraburkholderia polaris TaxID=2728848 RepID=A0A848ILT9_9BURK|nr:ATP-binding protein [Paraburkholderia polaris]NMM03272.1 AAA family ATPase [Paraburkholderia polaris]
MIFARIADWIETQQPWLSDAARRLVINGRIDDAEIGEIVALAKAHAGIDDPAGRVAQPLTRDLLPASDAASKPITLVALRSLRGVNAIAADQSILFSPIGVTVVYGNNGAGKSGYSRVLRKACRARATGGLILGDVFADAAGANPTAEILIQREGAAGPEMLAWRQGSPAPAELATVAVFDSQCARAFTDAEGEVAYTPRGLDVLAKLATLCGTLRARLELEISSVHASAASFADLLGEHAAGRSLAAFEKRSHLPAYRKELAALATLSEADVSELQRLAKELAEANPAARAADLRGKRARIEGLATRWERCEAALSDEKAVAAIGHGAAVVAAETAARLAAEAFAAEGGLLPGTGSDPWRALLSAARHYSTTLAYPEHHFPHVDGSRCVLCQQDLAAAAAERMRRFETFVEQEAQKLAEAAKLKASAAFSSIASVDAAALLADHALMNEIEQAKPGAREGLQQAGDSLSNRQAALAEAWAAKRFDAAAPAIVSHSTALRDLSRAIEEEAARFDKLAAADGRKKSEQALADLKSRQALSGRLAQIIQIADDLALKKKLQAAHRAADSTPVSRKMSALHAEALSADAEAAFARECAALGVGHVPIRSTTRMERGKAKQQVKLDTSGGERVGEVLSEGEQRALALAAFMAEVSLVDGHGAIIFDDPMSSLDHAHREKVARRLVQEASSRQVIVFTHDLPFALHLADEASVQKVEANAMSVRRVRQRAGLVFPELPFAGIKVSERLERIKKMAMEADGLLDGGEVDRSENLVRTGYGRLRETWERGVEETILCETVVRFRPGVSTQRLRAVTLSDEEYVALHEAMARCSHFAAHDTAADADATPPTPDELRADIEAARVFFAARKKLNDDTDRRRRELLERSAAFKQA